MVYWQTLELFPSLFISSFVSVCFLFLVIYVFSKEAKNGATTLTTTTLSNVSIYTE
jgi:hypothetical protein